MKKPCENSDVEQKSLVVVVRSSCGFAHRVVETEALGG
jgi:hypothetical protein